MSYKPTYVSGLWIAICDVCGRQFKSNELRLRWDNLMVCQEDFEPRQPQDFVRGVADIQAPPWTRPQNTDSFVDVTDNLLTEAWAMPQDFSSFEISTEGGNPLLTE